MTWHRTVDNTSQCKRPTFNFLNPIMSRHQQWLCCEHLSVCKTHSSRFATN